MTLLFFFGGCAAECFPASSAILFHTSPMSDLPGPVSSIATVGYHRDVLKSSLFVLFSLIPVRNSVLQKSSLFGFTQTECRICHDVLGFPGLSCECCVRLVFVWKHSGVLLLKSCVALRFGLTSRPFRSAITPPCFQTWHGAWSARSYQSKGCFPSVAVQGWFFYFYHIFWHL